MSTRNEGGKKLLCVLLTVLMLFCMIPSAAFASEAEDNTQAVSIDITVQDGSEFLLATQKRSVFLKILPKSTDTVTM